MISSLDHHTSERGISQNGDEEKKSGSFSIYSRTQQNLMRGKWARSSEGAFGLTSAMSADSKDEMWVCLVIPTLTLYQSVIAQMRQRAFRPDKISP